LVQTAKREEPEKMRTTRQSLNTHPNNGTIKSNGFTFVELLVVLGIMALASALLIGPDGLQGNLDNRQKIGDLQSQIIKLKESAVQTGGAQKLDLEALNLSLLPAIGDNNRQLLFYPDGSSNGGKILQDDRPIMQIRWIDGRPLR